MIYSRPNKKTEGIYSDNTTSNESLTYLRPCLTWRDDPIYDPFREYKPSVTAEQLHNICKH